MHEGEHTSPHVTPLPEPSTGPMDTRDVCYADGLGQVECLGAPTSPSFLLPLMGGRQRVNLFTTSAPGSGDELRLAHCPPWAGPGLSHGGQMTTEAKWVPSCSPWELPDTPPFPSGGLPFQSTQAFPGKRAVGEGPEVEAATGPFPDQRTTGQIPTPPPLPSQAHSTEHPPRRIPCPLGHPGSGQRPPRMPSAPSLTCKASDAFWKEMKC